MGIYINMEMPKGCGFCPIKYFDGDGDCCPFVGNSLGYSYRPDDCPLIPVPPHGRLGDLDKLVEKIDGIWDCNDMVFKPDDHCCNIPEDCKGCKWAQTKDCIQRMVENAPIIIPAEPPKEK